jgi:ATP-dependent protease ClpP protease subunit/roadblock/LC7 domain-containing protein
MKDLDSLPRLYVKGTIAQKQEGEVFGESFSAADVIEFLDANKDETDIVVEISSYGGSVAEGKEIYTRLIQSGKNITTVTFKAYSIATLLMLTGRKRLIVENADFGIHQARVFGDDLQGMELLAADLFKIGKEIEQSSEEILNIYCRTLGEDRRSTLLAKMAQDINLGAREAIKLGFANGYYKKAQATVENSYRPITITNHLSEIIKNNMAEKKNEGQLEKLEALMVAGFGKIAKMFAKIKNEVTLPTKDGKSVYVVPVNPDAPDDLKGAKVYLVDEAGLPTETLSPPGEIPLEDGSGRVLVVGDGGVVSEVREAVDANKLAEEKAALQTENAALQAKLTAMENQMASDKAQAQKEVVAIQNAFSEYKKLIPGDHGKSDKDKDEDPKADFAKMSTAQKVRFMSKQAQKLEKENKELLNK